MKEKGKKRERNRERKSGKRKEIKKRSKKMVFDSHRKIPFWGRKSYFFPRGKEHRIFSRCESI